MHQNWTYVRLFICFNSVFVNGSEIHQLDPFFHIWTVDGKGTKYKAKNCRKRKAVFGNIKQKLSYRYETGRKLSYYISL